MGSSLLACPSSRSEWIVEEKLALNYEQETVFQSLFGAFYTLATQSVPQAGPPTTSSVMCWEVRVREKNPSQK